MKICFIMYPWQSMEVNVDSTLLLHHECALRKHTVAYTTTSELTIRNSITMANCKVLKKGQKIPKNPVKYHKTAKFEDKMLPLEGFDVIMMRDDPPLDPLVLNFLDSIKDDVFLVNSIRGLREANNKIYTAAYYDPHNEMIPVTHVSKNKAYLKKVIEEHPGDKMIMKPLNGFGGKGVIVIEKSAMQNVNSLLDFYINGQERNKSNYVIIQDYVPGAEKGDIRVIMVDGEPIGSIRRVPAEGEARSNISSGGTAVKHKLSKNEIKLCKKIGKKLVEDGIFLAGLDLISEKLIEVNVLSPGGLVEMNELEGICAQSIIVDQLEKQAKKEGKIISKRRKENIKLVENA